MDRQQLLLALAAVIVVGAGAQWLAWRLKLPSILLLLAAGFLVGPGLGIVRPDEMLGALLFPFVSMCVAIILFEGSLSLHFSQLREMGAVLIWLLTAGVLVTWGLALLGAHYILGMNWFPATLLGAILVVTGPTVIGPILRQIRPTGQCGPVARWEGIVIDPIGAVLALLVFEAYHAAVHVAGTANSLALAVLPGLVKTVIWGCVIGGGSAWCLTSLLRRHAIPDHLESIVTLMFVVLAFTASNLLQHESGLVAVTLMGVLMANSKVRMKHIAEFKESLALLLISGLFILLAARMPPQAFLALGWRGLLFVAYMILIVRPASVLASTCLTSLPWRERMFLSWLAPRGIVAAAVASVFAIQLGPEDGAGLSPATFAVIVGTVIVYGLTSYPLARWLGLASSDPQGVLIVGANAVAEAVALALKDAGFPVLLADLNRWNIRDARMKGLRTAELNILRDDAGERLDLGGIGRALAMTPNDDVNSLAALSLTDLFGRANVFQVTPWRQAERHEETQPHLRARRLFDEGLTYEKMLQRLQTGSVIRATKLTPEFDFQQFRQLHPGATPLFVVQDQQLAVCDADQKHEFKPGQALIALVSSAAPLADDGRP